MIPLNAKIITLDEKLYIKPSPIQKVFETNSVVFEENACKK